MGEERVEFLFLLHREPECVNPMCFYDVQFLFPFQSHDGKYLFQICLVLCKLAYPFPDAMQVVVHLTGERTVFGRRNKSLDL